MPTLKQKSKIEYNIGMGKYDKKKEQFTPFSELCKFADEFEYDVLLEKPFKEMKNMFLIINDSDGEQLERITLKDISVVNKEAAKLLNKLSKKV